MTAAASIVLFRHGHSEWNLGDRFTGWTDIPLTEVGLAEASAAARRLAGAGCVFDELHGSVLRRARQTARAMLAGLGAPDLPVYASWRLNERHYGALQGMDKRAIFSTWGAEASRRWWRGYAERPPALGRDDPRHPRFDPLYLGLPEDFLPASESLRDCQQRVLPYWHEVVLPRMREGRRLLIVTHGNTLRALVMHLRGLSASEIEHVEIPSGVPYVCRLSADGRLLAAEWLDISG